MSDGRHPYFRVQGAERWFAHLAEAYTVAAASGRKVLVVYGRVTCAGSRALVEKTIMKEEIADHLNRHFVVVAGDAAGVDPDLQLIIDALPRHEPTPLCIYLTADGRRLHFTAGGRPAAVFLNDMLEATARK